MHFLKHRALGLILVCATIVVIFIGLVVLFPWGPGVGDGLVALPNGYYFHPKERLVAPNPWDDSSLLIPGNIITYNYDSRFIIAVRKPSPYQLHKRDYWILDTASIRIWGPLDKMAFDEHLATLKIDAELESEPTRANK